MKKTIFFSIFILSVLRINAQEGFSQTFMRQHPQHNIDNPARFIPAKGYIGLPGFSSLNLNITSTAFRYNTLFKTDASGYPTTLTTDKLVSKLNKNNNWLNVNLNEEILGFGFRTGPLFFSFSYRVRVDEYFKFSKDLFAFPLKGNMYYGDQPARLNAKISLDAYQEFSLGIQAEVTKRLYLGFRPKLLIGFAHAKSNALNANIRTNPETYDISLNYNIDAQAICAIPIVIEDEKISWDIDQLSGNYESLLKNLGFALDLGFIFRINDKMGVGASMSDFGFIRWKTNGVKFSGSVENGGNFYDNGNFYFKGLDFDQIMNIVKDDESRQEFLDSVKNYFAFDMEESPITTTFLNTRVSAEFYYEINPKHRFTAQVHGRIIGRDFYPGVTVAYNGKLAKVLDICAHYTIMPNSYTNLGFGFGLNVNPIYFYLATNNLLAYAFPKSAKQINLQCGFIFKWGKIQERIIKSTDYSYSNY